MNLLIFKEFLINLSLLINFIFIGSQIFRIPLFRTSKRVMQIGHGFYSGFCAVVLMNFAIHIPNTTTIIDLRNLPIILAASFGGATASLIAALITAVARVALFGLNSSSMMATVIAFTTAIGCSIIAHYVKNHAKRWLLLNGYTLIVSTIFLYLLLKNQQIITTLFPVYWTFCLAAGTAIYFLLDYLLKANQLFIQLQQQATTDHLTGLHNHRRFDVIFNEQITGVAERGEQLSLLLLDIDFFKKVNDTYGHPAGDAVLQELGKLLKTNTRSFDAVSRNGGEEFSVLMPDCSAERALEIAERIRKKVEHHSFSYQKGPRIPLTVSIGVATYPLHVENPADLIARADEGLYKAKRTGRNRVCTE